MQFSAQQIAALLGGALYGNANAQVSDVAPIEEAQAHHLSFVTEEKYLPDGQTFRKGKNKRLREKFKGLSSYPTLKCYLKAYFLKFTFN